MAFGRRSDERVHNADRSSRSPTTRHDLSPPIAYPRVHRQHATLEPRRQIVSQPRGQIASPLALWQTLYAIADFRDRDGTDKHPVFVAIVSSDMTLVSNRNITDRLRAVHPSSG